MIKLEYKITRKNELLNGWSILLFLIGFSALPFYMPFRYPEGDFMISVSFAIIGFLVFFIPQAIIHLKYYSLNEKLLMIYEPGELKVTIRNSKTDKTSVFFLDDIKLIVQTMTPAMAEGRMHWLPWDGYNYSIIYLKNGSKFIITSLMVYSLELPVGDKYETVTSFYPYPKY